MELDLAVHRVAAKLPPFWPDRPALWFAQVEAQFTVSGITQDATKFAYVVSQLESRYAAEVEDLIINPPPTDAYARLRSELIRRVSLSEEQRVRQLLTEEVLGDRKPSQFLRHLRSLAGPTVVQDSLLRTLWLQRLPLQMQAILQTQADSELDKIAELADKILEVTPTSLTAAAAHQCEAVTSPMMNHLAQRIEQLSSEVASLRRWRSSSRPRPRPVSRDGRQHSRDSGSPVAQGDNNRRVCWFHRRFGKRARKCEQPCDFPNAGGSQ
uniref:Retrotransposon gag domain-containing protein n=1 Tax=Trichuris muris TaxID=70415 RepID=A0A5S6Q4X7_TRIMR